MHNKEEIAKEEITERLILAMKIVQKASKESDFLDTVSSGPGGIIEAVESIILGVMALEIFCELKKG